MLSIIPILIYLLYNFKFNDATLNTLLFLFSISALFDLIGFFVSRSNGNTHSLFHIYGIFEAASFSVFYLINFKIKFLKISWVVGAILLFLIIVFSFFETDALEQVNDIESYTQGIIMSLFAIMLFYQMLVLLDEPILKNSYLFWMNTAILVYSSLPLFMFLTYRIFAGGGKSVSTYSWTIFMFSNILFHLFMLIGLCKYKKKEIL